jgi:hypothetical protein
MQVMIEKTGDHSLVHWTNKHMETVFAYACHWGHVGTAKCGCVCVCARALAVCRFALASCATRECHSESNRALRLSPAELAKYMLGLGADPTSVDSWLNTPVFHAALSGE